MSSATLLLAALALVITGLGLLLLAGAQSRARREQQQAFLQAQTEQVRMRYTQAPDPSLQLPARDLRRRWDDFLRRADLAPTRRTALLWLSPLVLCTLAGAVAGQWLGAVSALVVALAVTACAAWHRVRRLHKKLLSQLPGFLDGVVRLMTIGSSV
ncbi:MAG: hypothetical protein HOQ37_14745, partial [Cupriavidus sp.]|nr:hypothetical protein [Cupriavidus sp.]